MKIYNIYEIYTRNPEDNSGGWDIEFIGAPSRASLKSMPLFDQVILREYVEQSAGDVKAAGYRLWDGIKFI